MARRDLLMATFLLLFYAPLGSQSWSTQSECVIIHDSSSKQDVKIEAHGNNAVRVRAVPSGASFKDVPDIVSALVNPSTPSTECDTVALVEAGEGVTSGNLKATVDSSGKLIFSRVSDGKVLLAENPTQAVYLS